MGLVASIDGKQTIKVAIEGADPLGLGKQLAQEAITQGADQILGLTAKS
jgi:porphobilinogen deaminase